MPDFYTQQLHDLKTAERGDAQNLQHMLGASAAVGRNELEAINSKPNAYGQLAGRLKEKYGTGMNQGWQGVIQTALESASGSKKAAELEALQGKMQKLQDYATHVANATDEAVKNKEMAAKVMPLLKKYKEEMPNLSPADAEGYLKNVVGIVNKESNKNYEFYSRDAVDPNKITVIDKSNGAAMPINLLDMPELADIHKQQMMADLEKKALQYQDDRIAREKAQLDIEGRRVSAYEKDVNNRWTPQSQFDRAAGTEQGKLGTQNVEELKKQNIEINEQLSYLNELEKLLDANKSNVITGNSLTANVQRALALQGGTKQYTYSDVFDALGTKVTSVSRDMSMKYGNMNQKEFENATRGMPNSRKTREANLYLIHTFRNALEDRERINNSVIGGYENFNPKTNVGQAVANTVAPIQQNPAQTPIQNAVGQAFSAQNTNQTVPQAGLVKMKSPVSGKVDFVPSEKVDEAKNDGYTIVN